MESSPPDATDIQASVDALVPFLRDVQKQHWFFCAARVSLLHAHG